MITGATTTNDFDTLPRYWIEDHWGNKPHPDWRSDRLSKISNVVRMVRVDVGMMTEPSGHMWYKPGQVPGTLAISPSEFAESVANRAEFITGGDYSRPWALNLVGIDGKDRALKITRHADDAVVPETSSPAPIEGIRAGSKFFSEAWALTRARLADRGIPDPAFGFMNHEAIGDVGGYTAWHVLEGIKNSRQFNVYKIDGDATILEWLERESKTLSGDPIENPGPSANVNFPEFFDFGYLVAAMVRTATIRALSVAVLHPFYRVFPTSIPWTEWNVLPAFRSNPVPVRPGQAAYIGAYTGAFQTVTPAVYSCPMMFRTGPQDQDLTPLDPRFETATNWARWYGLDGDPQSAKNVAESGERNGLEVVRSLRLAGMRVSPSISISGVGKIYDAARNVWTEDPDRRNMLATVVPAMSRFIANASRQFGCRDYWVFEPSLNDSPLDREFSATLLESAIFRLKTRT